MGRTWAGADVRYLYLAFLLALAVTVFGFWPTTVGAFGPPDGLRILHGLFAAGWMVMLVAQSWLIGHGYRRAHRWIGWTSLIVAPGTVITALMVLRDSQGPGSHFGPELLMILNWIDVWSLLLFSVLYVAAIVWRRTMSLHARFLGSTVFVAIVPALGRAYGMNIPALGGLRGALNPCFWTVEMVLVGLILLDASRQGGFRARSLVPYALTLAALVAIQLTMFGAPGRAWFVGLIAAAS